MCSTIAPNCGGIGDAQFITESYAAEREPIYGPIENLPVGTGFNNYASEPEPIYRAVENNLVETGSSQFETERGSVETTTTNAYTLDSDGRRQYGHYGRNRSRNRSELWTAASRDLVTERPNWNVANQHSFSGPIPDNGRTQKKKQ